MTHTLSLNNLTFCWIRSHSIIIVYPRLIVHNLRHRRVPVSALPTIPTKCRLNVTLITRYLHVFWTNATNLSLSSSSSIRSYNERCYPLHVYSPTIYVHKLFLLTTNMSNFSIKQISTIEHIICTFSSLQKSTIRVCSNNFHNEITMELPRN